MGNARLNHALLVAAARILLAFKDVRELVKEELAGLIKEQSSPDIVEARIVLARRNKILVQTAYELNLWLLRWILRQDPNTEHVFRMKLKEAGIVLSRAEGARR